MTTPPDTPKPPAAPIQVMEGVSGTWFYHLGRKGQTTALCGARVMTTQVPLSAWGHVGHLHERWCAKCADLHVAPSPQESHKLAEELERLIDDGASCSADKLHEAIYRIGMWTIDKANEIRDALRSSPSEQADAKVWRDRATRAAHLLDEHSLTAPDHEDEAQRLICEIEDAAIAASGGAKT